MQYYGKLTIHRSTVGSYIQIYLCERYFQRWRATSDNYNVPLERTRQFVVTVEQTQINNNSLSTVTSRREICKYIYR